MTVGNAVKGAVGGAAAGSVLGPWGTAGGALVGGAVGALTGNSNNDAHAMDYNYQLGQGYGTDYSNQIAGALANRGNAADATASLQQSQAQGAYGVAAGAQGIGAPQIQQDAADRQRQLAALGGTNASASSLTGAAGQLQQLGTDGMPMGLAAAQLQQGENANMNQSLALAHSGRTLGGGAAALQAAQFQNAQTGQVTNQQAATANIQEQQQNQQFKLGALGAAQQGYGSAGGLYGQAGTQAAGVNQTDLGVQQTNAGLQQSQQGVNNQTSSTFGQMGASLNQGALGQQQLAQGYQGQGLGVLNAQLGANEKYSEDYLGQSNQNRASDTADNTQTNSMLATGLQGASNYLGQNGGSTVTSSAAPRASDRDAKTGIQPANMALSLQPQSDAAMRLASLGGSNARLQPAGPLNDTQAAANTLGAPASALNPNGMPSGAPTHAASPMGGAPMTSALGQLSGVGTTANTGPVAALPNQDPYLAAMGGTGGMYLPQASYIQPGTTPAQEGAALDAKFKNLYGNGASKMAGGPLWGPPPPPPAAPTHQLAGVGRASDVHSKTRIFELESQLAALRPPDTTALDAAYRSQGGTPIAPPAVDLRPAQGYSYEYKDPAAHGQGRFYGPMAQDLEQTPAGASTVKKGPDGTKMVDTSRLSLVNTSAISEQQRKLGALQAQLAALSQPQMDAVQRGFPASYPTPRQPGAIDVMGGMQRGWVY